MIYIGADHRGFELKEILKEWLGAQKYEVQDVGAFEFDKADDYVDFAKAVVEKMLDNPMLHKGIILCGSGHGVSIVADKYKGVRAALCFNRYVAVQSRQHEDANVLVLPADWLKEKEAKDIVFDWLGSQFTADERHVRRLKKIEEIEDRNFKGPGKSKEVKMSFM